MPSLFAFVLAAALATMTPAGLAAATPEPSVSRSGATDFSAHRKRVSRSVHYHTHYHVHYWGGAYAWQPYAGYGWQRPYYYRAYLPIYYRPYPIVPYRPWW